MTSYRTKQPQNADRLGALLANRLCIFLLGLSRLNYPFKLCAISYDGLLHETGEELEENASLFHRTMRGSCAEPQETVCWWCWNFVLHNTTLSSLKEDHCIVKVTIGAVVTDEPLLL